MTKNENTVALFDIEGKIKHMRVYIEGDGDIVLNKMNNREFRKLTAPDRKAVKEVPNYWEDVVTSIHWRDKLPVKDTYTECTEETMKYALENNAPCITAFGLKKSFEQAVTRNEIDKYSTKFSNAVNINAVDGLVPIEFCGWRLDEKVMSPQRGSAVSVRLNHFHNWKANFVVDYLDHVYSRDQILNVINLAGFGLGIGSGRSSGFGRYHIVKVEG